MEPFSTLEIISDPSFPGYNIIKFSFITVSLIILGTIIYLLRESTYLEDRFEKDLFELLRLKPASMGRIAREWRKTNKRLESEEESDYKLAVLEADSLVNKVLERMEIEGEDLEEKLENVSEDQISNLGQLRIAHRTRNNIAHDPDYRVEKEEAKDLLKVYEKSLQDLKAF